MAFKNWKDWKPLLSKPGRDKQAWELLKKLRVQKYEFEINAAGIHLRQAC